MRNKYQKQFWIWFGISIIYGTLIALSNSYSLSKSTFLFYQITAFFLYFFIFSPLAFVFFDLRWTVRMSSRVREILSFEEYFDLKRSLNQSLTTQDRDYAKEKLGKDLATEFLKNQYKNQKIPVYYWLMIVIVIVAVLFDLFFFIVYEFEIHVSPSLIFLSGAMNVISGTWFIIIQYKPIKNRFLFAKKVDELVEAEKTSNLVK